MTITTLSSQEFKQDSNRAKKAAKEGPVFIADSGKPTHVLLSIEAYKELTGGRAKIADVLAMHGPVIAFDPPRANIADRTADFEATGAQLLNP